MESESRPREIPVLKPFRHLSDPLVVGAGAFFFGFLIGAGRWSWLGKESSRLAESLGTLAINYVSVAFQEKNPDLFTPGPRVTH